jgi:hypothetical protein
MSRRFNTYLVPGLDRDADGDLLSEAEQIIPEVHTLLVEHPLKPCYVMLTPPDQEAAKAALPEGATDIPAISMLIGKNGYGMNDNTAQSNFAARIDSGLLATVRDWWSTVPAFDFTVAGDVIGFVNARRHFNISNVGSVSDLLGFRAGSHAR